MAMMELAVTIINGSPIYASQVSRIGQETPGFIIYITHIIVILKYL